MTCCLEFEQCEERRFLPTVTAWIYGLRVFCDAGLQLAGYELCSSKTAGSFEIEEWVWGHFGLMIPLEPCMKATTFYSNLAEHLAAESFQRFQNAIRLHSNGMANRDSELSLLAFIAGLECLFSVSPQELTFRLSLTVAKFLGETEDAQYEIFQKVRELYAVRSKLAHGDKIDAQNETTAIVLAEHWVPRAEGLLRASIVRILEKGLCDVFIKKDDHARLIDKLPIAANLQRAVQWRRQT